VRVIYPERPRKVSTFEFMHGTVSSERPSEAIIARIAREILKLKQEGGEDCARRRPGNRPHRGRAGALAKMIREGYIDVLFAGNALATHDIESNLFGTSLGMDVRTGTLVTGGP